MPKIDLSQQISKLLLEYGDQVRDVINTVLPDVGDQTVQHIKTDPATPRKTGEYAAGWRAKPWAYNSQYKGVTIYNAKKPQLTHLLEFGHARRGGGREVPGKPHIAPAEEFAEELLTKEVVEGVSRIK